MIEIPRTETLTAVQETRRAELIERVNCGLAAFVDVGNALLELRDFRLYRSTHPTFEAFCKDEFGFSRQHAYRMIDAAGVVAGLSPVGDILPASERVARELARLPSEERPSAWLEVVETAVAGGITAEQMKLSVDRRIAVKVGRSGEHPTPPMPAGRYSLIYSDPPWQYDFSNFSGKVAENHFPTMPLEAICALPVDQVAAPDCVLFLWGTAPKLPDAFAVAEAWGFEYKTCAMWEKPGKGLGYYFRVNHEVLLVATRGKPGIPLPGNRPVSVIHAKKGRHSEKPDVVYELLEQMYPESQRLEMFARGTPRPGWTFWGNQVEALAA